MLKILPGSKELYNERIRSSSPLNTDKTITNAMVPMATPTIDILEMILIKFFFFLDPKYRRAIKKETFKVGSV